MNILMFVRLNINMLAAADSLGKESSIVTWV